MASEDNSNIEYEISSNSKINPYMMIHMKIREHLYMKSLNLNMDLADDNQQGIDSEYELASNNGLYDLVNS